MFGLGSTELVIIFLVILLLFGGKKIPEIARGLGKSLKEFKSAREEKLKDSSLEVTSETASHKESTPSNENQSKSS